MLVFSGMEEAIWHAVNADSRNRWEKSYGDAYEALCVPTIEQAMEYEAAREKDGKRGFML